MIAAMSSCAAGAPARAGRSRLLRGRLAGHCRDLADLLEDEIAVLGVDADGVAFGEVALEEPKRERVLDQPLDRALQRASAIGRVPAGLREHLFRSVGDLEVEAALGQPLAQAPQLQLDDRADLVARER